VAFALLDEQAVDLITGDNKLAPSLSLDFLFFNEIMAAFAHMYIQICSW
jgi:hypothetical protein